jgi:hypothetical protein
MKDQSSPVKQPDTADQAEPVTRIPGPPSFAAQVRALAYIALALAAITLAGFLGGLPDASGLTILWLLGLATGRILGRELCR